MPGKSMELEFTLEFNLAIPYVARCQTMRYRMSSVFSEIRQNVYRKVQGND